MDKYAIYLPKNGYLCNARGEDLDVGDDEISVGMHNE
jgi:hypothetical protein